MNTKRIQELSEQAMAYAESHHGRFHSEHQEPDWDTFYAYTQKFAELIIQEAWGRDERPSGRKCGNCGRVRND